jgi:replicative DNA helicase
VAADNELRLISRAIRTRDIGLLLERGLHESWFYDDENRAVWKFVLRHWQKYGEVPTAVTVKDNFPNFRLLNVEDTAEYLIDQLIAYRRRQATIEIVASAATVLQDDADYETALKVLQHGVSKMADEGIGESRDLDLSKDASKRFEEYMAIKTRPNGLLGLPTGFATIDHATGGLQPGQLITVIATPKTGKSVLALQIACNIHEDGAVPVFQSFEMSNLEQQHRHDAMRAHIAHSRLVRGSLRVDEEVRYKKMLARTEQMHKFYLTDAVSATTLSALTAKVEKLQPEVIFVDGVYLMLDEVSGEMNSPTALTNITRSLKRLAQKMERPVVITTQVLPWKMKKGAVSADAIGYSSSFFQDSDVILGLQRIDEDDDTSRRLKVVASRNSGPAETELMWDWEEGKFEEYKIP